MGPPNGLSADAV